MSKWAFKVSETQARNITSKELIALFFNTWVPIARYPAVLRVDPEGAWMSKETDQAMSDISCEVDPIPERHIGSWDLQKAAST